MGIKTGNQQSDGPGSMLFDFIQHITDDPTAEILATNSEWEAFRYRRKDVDTDGHDFGVYSYGIVYRNKKGRLNFTGIAADDFERWPGSGLTR